MQRAGCLDNIQHRVPRSSHFFCSKWIPVEPTAASSCLQRVFGHCYVFSGQMKPSVSPTRNQSDCRQFSGHGASLIQVERAGTQHGTRLFPIGFGAIVLLAAMQNPLEPNTEPTCFSLVLGQRRFWEPCGTHWNPTRKPPVLIGLGAATFLEAVQNPLEPSTEPTCFSSVLGHERCSKPCGTHWNPTRNPPVSHRFWVTSTFRRHAEPTGTHHGTRLFLIGFVQIYCSTLTLIILLIKSQCTWNPAPRGTQRLRLSAILEF